MVQVVNRSQRVVTQGLNPKEVYSRVVTVECVGVAVAGSIANAVTPGLGNRLWLLGVDLKIMNPAAAVMLGCRIFICHGTGVPATRTELLTGWTDLLPHTGNHYRGLNYIGIRDSFHWDMNKLMVGEATRLGVDVENCDIPQIYHVAVSFHISEG